MTQTTEEMVRVLRRLADDERRGANRYLKLSGLFKDIGGPVFSDIAKDMAADEYGHERKLRMFARWLKEEFSRRIQGG